jgi:phospholipid/cholesterol/gamma-HCH transport system substrate-binding protein
MQSAWKVGLLVAVFGVLFYLGYGIVGNSLVKKPVDTYYALFNDAGGITSGAIVTMAGVKVGKIAKVELANPKQARMTLSIAKGVFVPNDAILMVPSSLLSLGDQRIDLVSERGVLAGRLPVGATIKGMKGSVLQSVLPEGETTITELNATLKALREMLGDGGVRKNLVAVLDSTNKTISSLNTVVNDVHGILSQSRSSMTKVMNNAAATVDDLRAGINRLMAQFEGKEVTGSIKEMLKTLAATSERAADLVEEMHTFVADPTMRTSLANTMANLETMSRTGIDIAENTKKMSADGTQITSRAIELADSAKEIAAEAKGLLAKLNDFLDRLPGGVKVAQPAVAIESARNMSTDRFQTDVFFKYPLSGSTGLFVGVNDVTERNFVTAQYAQSGPNMQLRYGVYSSRPGVGVDWQATPKLSLTGDLFDPNDLRLSLRARYLFGSGAYGWLGIDRVFDSNQVSLGVGVKR